MKKAFYLVLAVALVFGTLLCGCGRYSDADYSDNTTDGVIGNGVAGDGLMDDTYGNETMDNNNTTGNGYATNNEDTNRVNGNFNGGSTVDNGIGGRAAGNSDVTQYTTIAPYGGRNFSASSDFDRETGMGR